MIPAENVEEKIDLIAEMLREEGYKAKCDHEQKYIESAFGGAKVMITPRGKFLQFYCGILADEENPYSLESINSFNKEYKFFKLYLDDDLDAVIVVDFIFDALDDKKSAEYLHEMVDIFEAAIFTFRQNFFPMGPESDALKGN